MQGPQMNAFIALSSTLLVACSLFIASDGLSGDAAKPASSDDAQPAPDRGSDDARGDALADAQIDASWCAKNRPTATYCVDFDDGRPLSAHGIVTGPARIAPALGVEGTSAALFELPDASTPPSAYVRKDFFGVASSYEVDFTVRVDAHGSSRYFESVYLEFPTASGKYVVIVAINGNVTFSEQANDTDGRVLATVSLDMAFATHVAFSVDMSVTPWALKLRINGIDTLDGNAESAPAEAPAQATLSYGAPYSNPSSAKRIVIDNVVLDRKE